MTCRFQLANEEVNIISGALELKTKRAGQIMTIIDDIFMLPYNTVLDFETVSNIIRQGYTRIPVFDGNRDTIVALLNIKGWYSSGASRHPFLE